MNTNKHKNKIKTTESSGLYNVLVCLKGFKIHVNYEPIHIFYVYVGDLN